MPDLINWKPRNLPPGAVQWGRQMEEQVQSLKRLAERADQSGGNTDKVTASTMSSLSDQIQTIQVQQATLISQQATLTAAVNSIAANQASIIAQQNYINGLQPVAASSNVGNTTIAAGAWATGSLRPSVSLTTVSTRVRVIISAAFNNVVGTYSVSGDRTITRDTNVAGNNAINALFYIGADPTPAIGASHEFFFNCAVGESLTITAEFQGQNVGSTHAIGFPQISAQSVGT